MSDNFNNNTNTNQMNGQPNADIYNQFVSAGTNQNGDYAQNGQTDYTQNGQANYNQYGYNDQYQQYNTQPNSYGQTDYYQYNVPNGKVQPTYNYQPYNGAGFNSVPDNTYNTQSNKPVKKAQNRNNKKLFILGGVGVLIVIAAIAIILLLVNVFKGGDTNTPEEVAKIYMKSLKEQDVDAILELLPPDATNIDAARESAEDALDMMDEYNFVYVEDTEEYETQEEYSKSEVKDLRDKYGDDDISAACDVLYMSDYEIILNGYKYTGDLTYTFFTIKIDDTWYLISVDTDMSDPELVEEVGVSDDEKEEETEAETEEEETITSTPQPAEVTEEATTAEEKTENTTVDIDSQYTTRTLNEHTYNTCEYYYYQEYNGSEIIMSADYDVLCIYVDNRSDVSYTDLSSVYFDSIVETYGDDYEADTYNDEKGRTWYVYEYGISSNANEDDYKTRAFVSGGTDENGNTYVFYVEQYNSDNVLLDSVYDVLDSFDAE